MMLRQQILCMFILTATETKSCYDLLSNNVYIIFQTEQTFAFLFMSVCIINSYCELVASHFLIYVAIEFYHQ